MTNKYKYFVANWKMFGDIKTLNSLNKVAKLSKSINLPNLKLFTALLILYLVILFKILKKLR